METLLHVEVSLFEEFSNEKDSGRRSVTGNIVLKESENH